MNSASRSRTYAAADLWDLDGIKTSFATSASIVTLVPADFSGVGHAAGVLDLPRTITISRSNNSGQFSVSPIVITGLRGGGQVTETWTPANANGNDIFKGSQAFDVLQSIALPAQGGTGGTFLIGTGEICAPSNGVMCAVELAAAGTLNLAYGGTDTAYVNTDAIPVGAASVGFPRWVKARRVLTDPALAAATTVGLTVYIP